MANKNKKIRSAQQRKELNQKIAEIRDILNANVLNLPSNTLPPGR